MQHGITGADLEGGSIFGRDRAPDFVWVPQAKRMHQIVRIDLQFFSASEWAHPPQTPPVPIGANVLSVLNFGAPSFKKSWIRPASMPAPKATITINTSVRGTATGERFES